jgi:hypothetical protein
MQHRSVTLASCIQLRVCRQKTKVALRSEAPPDNQPSLGSILYCSIIIRKRENVFFAALVKSMTPPPAHAGTLSNRCSMRQPAPFTFSLEKFMHKKSSALLIALLTSAGLAMAAEDDGVGFLGPDPTAVTGALSSGAATDPTPDDKGHVIGAGVSSGTSSRGDANDRSGGGQGDGSGTAYIDCPGNAFSGGIRNDPKGNDCVPPDSVVIQGDDNMTRGSMTEDLSQGIGSSARGSRGTSNAATQSPGNQINDLGTGDNTPGAATRSSGDAGTMGATGTTGTTGTTSTMGAAGSTADTGSATRGTGAAARTGTTSEAAGGTGGMSESTTGVTSGMGGTGSDIGITGSGSVGGAAGAGSSSAGYSGRGTAGGSAGVSR